MSTSDASKQKKQTKRRSLWWLWIVAGLVLAGALYVWRGKVRVVLRWVERRYFAHIGDKGPLQRVQVAPWKERAPGMWTRSIVFKRKRHWSRIRLQMMRLVPEKFELRVWWNRKPRRVRWVMKKTKALAAINAGFFAPTYRPLGFLKTHKGLIRKRMLRRGIDGVFFVRKGKKGREVGVATGRGFRLPVSSLELAFQGAPLLVVAGQRRRIGGESWRVDRRSALCLTKKGQIILMATSGLFNGLSLYELSLLMAAPVSHGGFGCHWGLNLDGGSSSQWAVRTPNRIIGTFGIAVPMYLLIHPRTKQKKADSSDGSD